MSTRKTIAFWLFLAGVRGKGDRLAAIQERGARFDPKTGSASFKGQIDSRENGAFLRALQKMALGAAVAERSEVIRDLDLTTFRQQMKQGLIKDAWYFSCPGRWVDPRVALAVRPTLDDAGLLAVALQLHAETFWVPLQPNWTWCGGFVPGLRHHQHADRHSERVVRVRNRTVIWVRGGSRQIEGRVVEVPDDLPINEIASLPMTDLPIIQRFHSGMPLWAGAAREYRPSQKAALPLVLILE